MDENKLNESACLVQNNINILGEDDFREVMDGQIRQWREGRVSTNEFVSFDGSKLRYYFEIPENAKAIIVIVHGFCEFWGKYHELAWYLRQGGYGFFFLEQRGHGYSERAVGKRELVHLEDYSQYVEDLHTFIEKVVLPLRKDCPLYLYAHSMGGAVGALFLEQYPRYFKRAILSSPMMDMKTGKNPKALIYGYLTYQKIKGNMKKLATGQKYFDGKPVFESSSCLSRARYDYQFEQRCQNENYQTYGATFGWVRASLKANSKLLRKAKKVGIPILMFTAGMDHLVNQKGQLEFAKKSGNTQIVMYENSKHEIFNALLDVRVDYYNKIFEFYSV